MKIAGIDYSMSCPAIVTCESTSPFSFENCKVHYLIDKRKYEGKFGANINGTYFDCPSDDIDRFLKISEWSLKILKDCNLALLEGYSMGSKGNVFNIAENTAMLKMQLHTNKIKYSTIAPTSVKKYATGKGNAKKPDMYTSFVNETKVQLVDVLFKKGEAIGSPISDIVDAFYITKHLYYNLF